MSASPDNTIPNHLFDPSARSRGGSRDRTFIPSPSQGMLPTTKSSLSVEAAFDASWGYVRKVKASVRKLKLEDFSLPSHGESRSTCGKTCFFVCREHDKHVNASLDGVEVSGKDVLEMCRASCGRIQCPICYEKSIAKMALGIEWRFEHFRFEKGHPKPIHVVASVPESMYDIDAKTLRSMAEACLKKVGVHGGCVIYHPWRGRCAKCGGEVEWEDGEKVCVECGCANIVWVYMPHFHSIGLGWIRGNDVKQLYRSSGWIVANLGVRKSVRATALYQLSHCGVAEGFSNIVWFGSMSRMKYPKMPKKEHKCPLCGGKMEKIDLDYLTKSDLLDGEAEGFFFVDPAMLDDPNGFGDDGG